MNNKVKFFASVLALPASIMTAAMLLATKHFGAGIMDQKLFNVLVVAFSVLGILSINLAYSFYKGLLVRDAEKDEKLREKDNLINRQRLWIDNLEQEITDIQHRISEAGEAFEQVLTTKDENEKKLKVYERMADDLPQAVIIMDKSGAIEWVNKGFENVTEYTSEEVIGRKPESFLRSKFRRPESGADDYSLTEAVYNYTKSGRGYWSSQSVSPVYNELGEIEKFIAIESELNEQEENEQEVEDQIQKIWEDQYAKSVELDKREEELREALQLCEKIKKEVQDLWLMSDQLDSGVIITDSTGKVEWVNEGFEKVFDCKFIEVAGKMPKFINPVLPSMK